MKRSLLSTFLIIILTGASFAQGLYLRVGGGYGVPMAASTFGERLSYSQVYNGTNTTNNNSTEIVTGSYGSGVGFNFSFGYKFTENFIFELGTQYLLSNKIKTFDNDVYKSTDPLNTYTDYNNDSYTTSAKGLLVNPSFIFSAGFGKAAPYGRFGVILSSPKISGKSLSYYNGDGVDSTEMNWEFKGGISLGFQGAIGMNWKLSEKLDFYTEVNFVSMTYYPGEYNLTKNLTWDGFDFYDNLPNMTVSNKKTVYLKTFDPETVNNTDYNYNTFNPDKPTEQLREAQPFSSLSVQVGIRLSLFKIVK